MYNLIASIGTGNWNSFNYTGRFLFAEYKYPAGNSSMRNGQEIRKYLVKLTNETIFRPLFAHFLDWRRGKIFVFYLLTNFIFDERALKCIGWLTKI